MVKFDAVFLSLLYFLCVVLWSANASTGWTDERLLTKTESSEDTKQLLGVLHNVLEKLQNRRMGSWERRHSRLPNCKVGDYCTEKKGPHFGHLCDCPRGSKCNFFFLKCL